MSVVERLRQPEYTGENRCTPCTVANTVIAVVLAAAGGAAAARVGGPGLPVGLAILAVGLASIYLRGYLVPGTPTLTKRYFPDWLLAMFDKLEEPTGAGVGTAAVGERDAGEGGSSEPDPLAELDEPGAAVAAAREAADGSEPGREGFVDAETLLLAVDAVEECEREDDLCLTGWFAAAWRENAAELRDDPPRRAAVVADLYDAEVGEISTEHDGRQVARTPEARRIATWETEGALVADLAAAAALADRLEWGAVRPEQRHAIPKALRSFLEACPLCEGPVAMTEDTVESCCRSFDVIAFRCEDCGEHFLEVNPAEIERAAA